MLNLHMTIFRFIPPEPLLGDLQTEAPSFKETEEFIEKYRSADFQKLNALARYRQVSRDLLALLKNHNRSFLLSQFLDFITRVSRARVLDGAMNQTGFESFLNRQADLSYEENRKVRARISGKYLPREQFSKLFPIGQNKVHSGSHAVTAHNPPDLDTTTASFYTFLEAFSCRVGDSLTVWNVPNGRPGPEITFLFDVLFPKSIFRYLGKNKSTLTSVALDISNSERLLIARGEDDSAAFKHNRYTNAIVLVDEEGYFIGDWRVSDVDLVGRIQRMLLACLEAYERDFTLSITELYSQALVNREACRSVFDEFLEREILNEAAGTQTQIHYNELDDLLKLVLNIPEGCRCSTGVFFSKMDEIAGTDYQSFIYSFSDFLKHDSFDNDGKLFDEAHELFKRFGHSYQLLNKNNQILRQYIYRMDISMDIKYKVLGFKPNYVTTRLTVDEVKSKIGSYEHISVVFPARNKKLIPVGVIHADQLEKPTLGTVTLTDFCNTNEIHLEKHLEIISVIDHHKSNLQTRTPAVVTIADSQSSNVLLAERAFEINDDYSTRNQSSEDIDKQLKEISKKKKLSPTDFRLVQKLYKKLSALENQKGTYYVSPDREFYEYLLFLNAIIDDTDLFSKITWRDAEVVADIMNRLKSIQVGKEVEICNIFDLPKDRKHIRQAVDILLKNKDLYSIYSRIYQHREKVVEENIRQAAESHRSNFFDDTKIQNRFVAVGQAKLYLKSWPLFQKHRDDIMLNWMRLRQMQYVHNQHLDLFIQMISTVRGHEEAYKGSVDNFKHKDEIWLSLEPGKEQSLSHFRQFLQYFKTNPKIRDIGLEISLTGNDSDDTRSVGNALEEIFRDQNIEFILSETLEYPLVILKFKAGSLNSRKGDVTPYLPK